MRADTAQTLDPLGGLTARLVVVVVVVLTALIIAISLSNDPDEIRLPVATAISLAAASGACVVLLRASSPFRAPFGLRPHLAITGLLAVTVAAECISTYGANTVILNGYGFLVVAVFLFPLGSYRPPLGVLATAAALASLIAVLALVQAPFLAAPFPPMVFAVVAAAPALATGIGAAVLSRHLVGSLREWQTVQMVADRSAAPGRMTPLAGIDDEVLPLLERVTTSHQVTAEDTAHARAVGATLRRLLVAESDASVLPRWRGLVIDPHGSISSWSMRQRAGMQALAEKVLRMRPRPDVSLRVEMDGQWRFEAVWSGEEAPERAEMAAFIATLGVAFEGIRFERTPSALTVSSRPPRGGLV